MSDARLPPLACTVRGCGRPLVPRGRTWTCERGHAFDRGRSGYVNLLQPQDRKSAHAGDSAEAVAARERLLGAGVGRRIIDAVVERAGRLGPLDVVTELGCGGGDVLAAVAAATSSAAIGIDLSVPAIERASRRYPDLTWVVANADRGVPLQDRSADLIVSFHGRRNPEECRRTLAPTGRLIVVVPAADDLAEIRRAVMGRVTQDDRTAGVLADHAVGFTLLEQTRVREEHTLARGQLLDALQGTYRGVRGSQRAAVEGLEAFEVTVASEILVFRRAESAEKSQ